MGEREEGRGRERKRGEKRKCGSEEGGEEDGEGEKIKKRRAGEKGCRSDIQLVLTYAQNSGHANRESN